MWEKSWCDDSLSDKLAAEIYREKTCPWRRKPDRRNEPLGPLPDFRKPAKKLARCPSSKA
jgi:hypothetical protein